MKTDSVLTQHVICRLPLIYKQNKRAVIVCRTCSFVTRQHTISTNSCEYYWRGLLHNELRSSSLDVLQYQPNSGGLRHGRAGPLPRAPRSRGPHGAVWGPRGQSRPYAWASGATVSVLKRFCTNNLSRNIGEIWPFSKKMAA